MSDETPKKPKIIVDEDWKNQVEEEKESLKSDPDKAGTGQADDGEGMELPPASFSLLVTTLAAQAVAALGQGAPLDQEEVAVNLALAKHLVDTLEVLEKKTVGNLTSDEKAMLDSVLHELRMLFVAVQNRVEPESPPGQIVTE